SLTYGLYREGRKVALRNAKRLYCSLDILIIRGKLKVQGLAGLSAYSAAEALQELFTAEDAEKREGIPRTGCHPVVSFVFVPLLGVLCG
ncbi:MAG: hypothetical protein ACREUA_03500, partial [Burkholderiales bacterium]